MANNIVELVIRGTDRSAAAIASSVKNLQGMDSALGAIKGQLAGIVSVGALASLAKAAIDMGSALSDASKKYGVSAAELSKYSYVAKMGGVEFDSLGNAFKFLNKSISEAADPSSKAAAAFKALGITQKDLKEKSPQQVFEVLADRFSEMKDGANKTTLALELFGRAGADILPVMEKGGEGIRNMKDEAVKLGIALDEDTIKGLDAAGDAIDRMKMQMVSWTGRAIIMIEKLWEIRKAAREEWMGTGPGYSRGGSTAGADAESLGMSMWGVPKKAAPSIAGAGKKDKVAKTKKDVDEGWGDYADAVLSEAYDTQKALSEIDRGYWESQDKLLQQGVDGWVAYADVVIDENESTAKAISDGMTEAWRNTITIMDDVAIAGSLALGDLRENIVDLVMTGKANFHDMAEAFIRDMLRIAAQWAIIAPLTSGLGSALGMKIPIPGLASGGPVSAGHPYIVGERGPELFVPASSGAIVPNGGGGGVTVNIRNESGVPVAGSASSRSDNGDWIVDVWLEKYNRNVGGLRTVLSGV